MQEEEKDNIIKKI